MLKEVNVPPGYRAPKEDVLLHYDVKTNLLTVENPWTTGAESNFTTSLYQNGGTSLTYENGGEISKETAKAGLALAVPMIGDPKDDSSWRPIYGSNMNGFFEIDPQGDILQAVRMAMLYQIYLAEKFPEQDYREWYLSWSPLEDRYQGVLQDMPGTLDRYFRTPEDKDTADMAMGYYFLDMAGSQGFQVNEDSTTEQKIDTIVDIVENAIRAAGGDPDKPSADVLKAAINNVAKSLDLKNHFGLLNTDNFNRVFASYLYLADFANELIVHKVDENGKNLAGAEFGLFVGQYKEGTEAKLAASGSTDERGIIRFTANPSQPGDIHYDFDEGPYYFLKELAPPSGYQGVAEIIDVLVTNQGVFANAGEANDGITVRAEVGELVQTMVRYATDGSVDVTLRDILVKKQTADRGESFKDSVPLETRKLHYGVDTALMEYGAHPNADGTVPTSYFETDEGFLRAAVFQNFNAHEDTAKKTDLGDLELSALFSGATVVLVKNKKLSHEFELTAKKTLENETLSDGQFKFLLAGENGAPMPEGAQNGQILLINDKDGLIKSGLIKCERAGEYHYTLTELKGDDSHIRYDESVYGITVKAVTGDKPEEGFYFTVSYQRQTAGGQESVSGIEFINRISDDPGPGPDPDPDPDPKKGNLKVSKTVTGSRGSKTKPFTFTVTLDNSTIQGTYGDMEFKDGAATFTLRHNESRTAKGLPADTAYKVEESDNAGYTVTKNGDTGTIPEGGTAEAHFRNYRGGGGEGPDPGPDPEDPHDPNVPKDPDDPGAFDPRRPQAPLDGLPKTGEQNRQQPWLWLAGFFAVGSIAAWLRLRRKEEEE